MDKKKIFEEFWEQYVDFYTTIQYMYDGGVDLWDSSVVDPPLKIVDLLLTSLFGEESLDIFSNFIGSCYKLSEDDCDELYNLLACES